MWRDWFDGLYADGAKSGRMMIFNLHPWVIGQPWRIRHLDEVLGTHHARTPASGRRRAARSWIGTSRGLCVAAERGSARLPTQDQTHARVDVCSALTGCYARRRVRRAAVRAPASSARKTAAASSRSKKPRSRASRRRSPAARRRAGPWSRPTSSGPRPITASARVSSRPTAPTSRPRTGYVRAGAPLVFPTRTVAASTVFPDLIRYKGLPLDYGRMEADRLRSERHAPDGHEGRDAERGPAQRARNAQHPRRAIGHVQGRVRCAPLDRSAAAGCPAGVRSLPPAAGRAGAGRRARRAVRRAIPTSTPCRCTASPSPSRIPTTPRTCGRRRTATSNFAMDVPPVDSTIAARLRAKGAIIYAKSVAAEFNGGPGNPGGPATAQDEPGGRRATDERLERSGLQSLRHRTRAARNERRLRRRRLGQPGDGRHLRADPARRVRVRRRETASRSS